MIKRTSVVAVYAKHTDAEAAIKDLLHAGFDMRRLSIVGKEHPAEEDVIGYYSTGDRMKYWGTRGAFWGGVWSLLFGSAVFVIPGVGPLVVAGPLVQSILSALEGAVVIGGVTALGAGLYSIGIPVDSVVKYETALKSDEFLLVAYGTEQELVCAKAVLESTEPTCVGQYSFTQHHDVEMA